MKWALSARARLDIRVVLSASEDQFGQPARRRYRLLLEQAIEDVAADPQRAGVHAGSREGLWVYHTRHARPRTPPGQRVGRPRHLIVFTITGDELRVLRILHDALDLPEHLKDL
jgi:toxin ParE1/3/4